MIGYVQIVWACYRCRVTESTKPPHTPPACWCCGEPMQHRRPGFDPTQRLDRSTWVG